MEVEDFGGGKERGGALLSEEEDIRNGRHISNICKSR